MFIATLIAAEKLTRGDISAATDALRDAGGKPVQSHWVEPEEACDIIFEGNRTQARSILESLIPGVDIIIQPQGDRKKKLLIADMDSTMITVECLDELADYAGFKAEVSKVTERAMRGEMEFEGALRERVALLKGLESQVIRKCHDERVAITPGARPLVQTMKASGASCLLVSGGFTLFADRVADAIGFDSVVANRLIIEEGRLTGTVEHPITGAATKRQTLIDAAWQKGIDLEDTLAVGDGANDIPMIEAAGLGVAYHAKPKLAAAADARIDHCDLSALLFAQGYARRSWIVD